MRSLASISIDLDNKWSYLKTHGDDRWRGFPTYLDTVVSRVLQLTEETGITPTVFAVGQDAELAVNGQALRRLVESGLELGNHSFHHEPWLHLKSRAEVEDEIMRAHQAIIEISGKAPVGFRGPGYSITGDTVRILASAGYLYDATTLPTFIGPLARAFYFRRSELDADQETERDRLFGGWAEGRRPIAPYRWDLGGGSSLLEMPVTTMPGARLPFHATYLLYLAGHSEGFAKTYLKTALRACMATGVEPSFLLHSLDFIGADDESDLGFFPGMEIDGATKRRLVSEYVAIISERFDTVSVGEHAARLDGRHLAERDLSALA